MSLFKLAFISLVFFGLTACSTVQKAQYSALEKVGVHKRDILIDRIEKTTESQVETKDQFQSAYEELVSLTKVEDWALERKYKKMSKAVAASEDKANELDDRIASVNSVATDLFKEWQQELTAYTNQGLRQTSEKNLQTTERRYKAIYKSMQTAQQRVQPVLKVLQDNTLYLKHNLNARAISGLSSEVLDVEDKVAQLIKQMESSITESKDFINEMQNR